MSDADGQNPHVHVVGPEAEVVLDEQPAGLADLKTGYRVKVTLAAKGGESMVVRVEATST
jgi:hypothetical protein